jgi:glucose/arabinose dehydrogenase
LDPPRGRLGPVAHQRALAHQPETIQKTLGRIKLPPGFKIRLYALESGARHLAVGPQGKALFVGTAETKVYAVTVDAASGVAGGVSELAPAIEMNVPNGVCFAKDGVLYVAEVNRVLSFPRAEENYQDPSVSAKAIVEQDKLLPVEDARSPHNARVCRVGPDGKLYIAMGQPYNVPPKRKMGEFNKWGIGGIISMNLDGSITRGIEIIVAVASVTANTGKRGGGKRTVWTLCRPAVSGLRSRRTWRRRAHSHDSFDLWTYDGTLEDIHHALYVKRRQM